MNTNLYTKELKRNRKNLLIWMGIVIGLTMMVLSIYPFMQEMGQGMTQLVDQMPVELQKAMGMDANTWSSPLGFYSTYYGIYIIVLVSIYTTSTGATILSKEEKDQTSEFLLTQPITRQTVFTTKMAVLFTLVGIIFIAQTLAAIAGFNLFTDTGIDWEKLAIMHIGGLVLILFFTTIGVLLPAFIQPRKNFMGPVVGLTFGSYFINAIGQSTEAVNWLSYFSPFRYMKFSPYAPDFAVNYGAAAILTGIGVCLLLIAYRFFKRKDIAG